MNENNREANSWPADSAGESSNSVGNVNSNTVRKQDERNQTSRRKRGSGTMTSVACNGCRKARVKCDGQNPHRCSRCGNRRLTCVYEPHTKSQKDELVSQLQEMRDKESSTRKELREQSIVIDILTEHGHVSELINRLRREPIEAVVKWLSSTSEFSDYVERYTSDIHDSIIGDIHDTEKISVTSQQNFRSPNRWTSVMNNEALIQHLLEIYFTWVHPSHVLFSETDFLEHFIGGQELPQSYCSSALVNAICAMACHFAPTTGGDDVTTERISNWEELQSMFLSEAKKHVTQNNVNWLSSIQALGVLFLAEHTAGRGRVATTYLRLAADKIPSKDLEGHRADVLEITRWGIHTLSTAWCAFTYQKPFNPQKPHRILINPQLSSAELEELTRRPYFSATIASFHANLFRIVHRTITLMCGAKGQITGEEALKRSQEFSEWQTSLPYLLQILTYEKKGSSASAQADIIPRMVKHPVFSLHIQYCAAVVGLFMSVVQHDPLTEEFRVRIRAFVLDTARRGLEILKLSIANNFQYWFLPMTMQSVVHLCDAILRHSPDRAEKKSALDLCVRATQSNPMCKISGPLLQMLRYSVHEVDPELSQQTDEDFGIGRQYSTDEILDACTRINYAIPTDQILRFMSPEFETQWNTALGNDQLLRSAPSAQSMRLDNVLNNRYS